MNCLKDEMYYRDRYDRLTVEECRQFVKRRRAESEREFATASRETKLWTELLYTTSLYFLHGERYANRDERESVRALRHQFSQMLGDTNWKLLTGGVTYCFGILTGRMRGLETEQELIELVRIRLKGRKRKV